ncbi:hypothetical protein RMCBS344292_13007 [Rhizopus microsporus]|nr:hypothetical protein RMCBS344292_13007 [Rhizopus microsporus]
MHLKQDPREDPITDIQIVRNTNTTVISDTARWTRLDVDLNEMEDQEQGRSPLWLYYTKDTSISKNPISSIIVKEGSGPSVAPEYTRIPVDLNDGVDGYHLFMYYSQDGPKDPITAITAKQCFTSNCYMDGWERVEKDLNKGVVVGMSVYLFYKREKAKEPVTDIVVLLNDQSTPEGYTKVDVNLNSVTLRGDDIYLWYKTSNDIKNAIQDLAIQFGPRPVTPFGWEQIPVNLNSANNGKDGFGEPTYLYIKKGYQESPTVRRLEFDQEGEFKILQIADLHFTNEKGVCRDVPSEFDCKGDDTTIEYINKLLDRELPNLVVFSGDNINAAGVSDARAAVFKFTSLVVQKKIPWLSREELVEVMRRIPYSLIEQGPAELPGVGNYIQKIYTNGTRAATHDFTLYFLDSPLQTIGDVQVNAVQKEQLEWVAQSDLEFQKQNSNPNAAIFFYAPVWEYHDEYPRLGDARESVSTPKNELSTLDYFKQAKAIKIASCGRDHVNDFCLEKEGIQLCYAGGAGVGGYGAAHMGWPRRSRIIKLSQHGQVLTTWKRLDDEKLTMIDFQTL